MTAADMVWSSSLKNTINLGNSIIGVSILAMPYCFEKCGIVLSSLLLLASGLVTRMTCHLLLKSAITARRRNYEFLAFHTFGPTGKLVVEIGILGFLLGSCVAFFVVMGDLAPPLASDFLLLEASPRLRLTVLLLLGTCVGLPLGLLRRLDSLTSLSALSLGFYCLLVFKVFVESFPVLWSGAWWDRVVLWRHDNLLSVLPIFAMALSCQPQLFEIFDTVNDPSLKRMNSVVNGAVQMCSIVYIMMGFFGYVAFCGAGGPLPGNVLVRLGSSLSSEFLKLGFVATLVVSFPLCLFPCRTSLHSLIFKRGSKFHDPSYDYIPDGQFRLLTVVLVGATLVTACMVPNIEIVLGLTGSTIGTLICVIMPALVFTRIQAKSTNERLLAKFLSWAGLCIMVACTAATLSQVRPPDRGSPPPSSRFNPAAVVVSRPAPLLPKGDLKLSNASPGPDLAKPPVPKVAAVSPVPALSPKAAQPVTSMEKRLEPPEPVEPPVDKEVAPAPTPKPAPVPERPPKDEVALDPEALKKEDHEIAGGHLEQGPGASRWRGLKPPASGAAPAAVAPPEVEVKKQEALLEKIAQEQKVQKKMLEDLQRELKQELAKHKQDTVPLQKRNGTLLDAAVQAGMVGRAAPAAVAIPAIPPAPAAASLGDAKKPQLPAVPPVAPVGAASGLVQNQDSRPSDKHPPPPPAPIVHNIPHPVPEQAAAPLPAQNLAQHHMLGSQQQRQADKLVDQVVRVPLSGGIPSIALSNQHAVPVQAQQPSGKKAVQFPLEDFKRKEEAVRAEETGAFKKPPLAEVPKVVIQHAMQQPRQQDSAKVPQHPLNAQNIVVQNIVPPVVPAADSFLKASENVVRPLDVILHSNKQASAHQPSPQNFPVAANNKVNIMQNPQSAAIHGVQQQALALDANRIAKQAVQDKVENLLKPQVRPAEVKEAAAGPHAAVHPPDNRPLVAKMSKTVKREAREAPVEALAKAPVEAPAEAPVEAPVKTPVKAPIEVVAEVSAKPPTKNVPVKAPASIVPEVVAVKSPASPPVPEVTVRKDVEPAAVANAVVIGDIPVKLNEKDGVVSPESLASRAHADVVLAKHEIRK
ncbi:uncharacterized protein LOC144101701 [Amblyomma americanum]